MEYRLRVLFGLSKTLCNIKSKEALCCKQLVRLCGTNQAKAKDNDYDKGSKENGLDVEALFLNKRVQEILKKVTGLNMNKVYRAQQQPLATPKYKFLTDEEVEKLTKQAEELAQEKLQMPPFMKERKPINEVISEDFELQGYDDCQYVFTDITYGIPDRKRLIVTRHPDGRLCHASWEQRYRMNCIYFPLPGREFDIPRMFLDDHLLEQVLNRHDYEFVLDRACAQFDPDDPLYIKTTQRTYEHINETKKFDDLHSTRHFGPLVFHLALTKNIDNILLHMIQKVKIEDAASVIRLYYIIHPSPNVREIDDALSYIQNFVEVDAKKKSTLQLAIQTYKELYQNILEDKNSEAV